MTPQPILETWRLNNNQKNKVDIFVLMVAIGPPCSKLQLVPKKLIVGQFISKHVTGLHIDLTFIRRQSSVCVLHCTTSCVNDYWKHHKMSNLGRDINIDPTLRKIRKNNYTNNMKLSSYRGSTSHPSFDYYGHKLIIIKLHSLFWQTTRIARSGILMWLETSWERQCLLFPLFVEQVHEQKTPLQLTLPRRPSFCRF